MDRCPEAQSGQSTLKLHRQRLLRRVKEDRDRILGVLREPFLLPFDLGFECGDLLGIVGRGLSSSVVLLADLFDQRLEPSDPLLNSVEIPLTAAARILGRSIDLLTHERELILYRFGLVPEPLNARLKRAKA